MDCVKGPTCHEIIPGSFVANGAPAHFPAVQAPVTSVTPSQLRKIKELGRLNERMVAKRSDLLATKIGEMGGKFFPTFL